MIWKRIQYENSLWLWVSWVYVWPYLINSSKGECSADQLAVVVPVPKAKQRKALAQNCGQQSRSGLPIGGWYYILCLPGAGGPNPKPCSIQGNAIRAEAGSPQAWTLPTILIYSWPFEATNSDRMHSHMRQAQTCLKALGIGWHTVWLFLFLDRLYYTQ